MVLTDQEKEILIKTFSNSSVKNAVDKLIDVKLNDLRQKLDNPKFRDYELIHGGILSLKDFKRELLDIKE